MGLLVFLVLVCALISAVIVQSVGKTQTQIKVAIVDNEDSLLSRILVRAVGQTEQIAALMKTERMGQEEASHALKNGECAAIIVLPEGFLDDIMRLREAKGTIILSNKMASQVSVVASAAKAGERLLAGGQYGVYCGEEILHKYNGTYEDFEHLYETANLSLIEEAAGASQKYFAQETVGYLSSGMSRESYFALCWTIAVLFLCSLFFMPLILSDCTHSLLSRLCTLGIGNFSFIRWKIILLWAFRLILIILAAIAMIPSGIMVFEAHIALSFLLTSLYITLIGTCVTMCFGNGITANILFAISGLFLCGGIVPGQLLPEIVTKLGDITPFGAAKAILMPAFGAAPDVTALISALVYAVGAAVIIAFHLERTRVGKGEVQV